MFSLSKPHSPGKNHPKMKKILLISLSALLFAAFAFRGFQLRSWKQGSDYSIKGGKYVFTGLKATILFDEAHPEKSKIAATIDARTVKTGNSLMDDHARDALGAARYPIISFVSSGIKRITSGRYEAIGKLTIKGVTKEINMPFAFDSKNNLIDKFPFVLAQTFSGMISIVPKDYGITRMGTPDKVHVEITVPVSE